MWRSGIDKKGRAYHKLTREVGWHLPSDVLSGSRTPHDGVSDEVKAPGGRDRPQPL